MLGGSNSKKRKKESRLDLLIILDINAFWLIIYILADVYVFKTTHSKDLLGSKQSIVNVCLLNFLIK